MRLKSLKITCNQSNNLPSKRLILRIKTLYLNQGRKKKRLELREPRAGGGGGLLKNPPGEKKTSRPLGLGRWMAWLGSDGMLPIPACSGLRGGEREKVIRIGEGILPEVCQSVNMPPSLVFSWNGFFLKALHACRK